MLFSFVAPVIVVTPVTFKLEPKVANLSTTNVLLRCVVPVTSKVLLSFVAPVMVVIPLTVRSSIVAAPGTSRSEMVALVKSIVSPSKLAPLTAVPDPNSFQLPAPGPSSI